MLAGALGSLDGGNEAGPPALFYLIGLNASAIYILKCQLYMRLSYLISVHSCEEASVHEMQTIR
jgi:hypothetical protein